MNEPLTEAEMKREWDEFMRKYSNASDEFKYHPTYSWMFDFAEFKKVMSSAHLPNPYLQMIRKN